MKLIVVMPATNVTSSMQYNEPGEIKSPNGVSKALSFLIHESKVLQNTTVT